MRSPAPDVCSLKSVGGGFIFLLLLSMLGRDKLSVTLRVSERCPEAVSTRPGCWLLHWHMTGLSCEAATGSMAVGAAFTASFAFLCRSGRSRFLSTAHEIFRLYWVKENRSRKCMVRLELYGRRCAHPHPGHPSLWTGPDMPGEHQLRRTNPLGHRADALTSLAAFMANGVCWR